MDTEETIAFAKRLMDEVWRPFDYTKLRDFYRPDVVGHHRAQTICLQDIENRLSRDRLHWTDPVYDITNLIVQPDAFALRFIFSATRIDTWKRDTTEGIYFNYLKDGKISEFWHLASVDFDYFEKQ